MLNLLRSLTSTLPQIALLLPLLLLIKRNYSKKQKRLLLLAALVLLAEGVIASGFRFTLFSSQQWNWTGKAATLIATILFVYFNPVLTRKAIGFTGSLKYSSWLPLIGVGGTALFLRTVLKVFSGNFHFFQNFETFAFQATLPGFSEEIIYRGILLGILNKVYPATISIFKARIGWGVLIISILFGLEHGISIDKYLHLDFNSQKFCMTMGTGFIMVWLKQRSGSLLPSVVFHNLWNLIVFS